MFVAIHDHPMIFAVGLLLADLAGWRLLPAQSKAWRVLLRLGLFTAYSLVIFAAGMSPLQPPPWPEAAPNIMGAVLGIAWWLLGARTLTVALGVLLMPRSEHTGRLLQDVLGAAPRDSGTPLKTGAGEEMSAAVSDTTSAGTGSTS